MARVLTQEAEDDRADFQNYYGLRGCSCHMGNPPCGCCTHPGNPINQEDESCWVENFNLGKMQADAIASINAQIEASAAKHLALMKYN